MKVLGGTYLEFCQETGDFGTARALLGSGLRAAAALRSVVPDLLLDSAIDDGLAPEAETVAAALGVEVSWRERSEPVGFHYWTPLSAPNVSGPSARASAAHIEDGLLLAFGMIESALSTDVEGLVFDPQQPRDLRQIEQLDTLQAGRLAIVANAAETRAMAAESDIAHAARKLVAETSAAVVITKRAARGALVTTAGGQELVGPWPTTRVWPIGSGDVFAAGFAWAWLVAGAEPVEAARAGAHAASRWCSTESLDLSEADFTPQGYPPELHEGRVYLAAPFFSLGQRWLVELVRDSLQGLGGEVFSPLHDVGRNDDSVARLDLEGLKRCSAVLALLDEADPGAMFEAGWAEHAQLPTVVYTESPGREDLKMVRGMGATVSSDLPTAVYRALWASMEAAV